jgi:hypothetical protein
MEGGAPAATGAEEGTGAAGQRLEREEGGTPEEEDEGDREERAEGEKEGEMGERGEKGEGEYDVWTPPAGSWYRG